ncbi:hypothetical protein [Moraxella lacunata]
MGGDYGNSKIQTTACTNFINHRIYRLLYDLDDVCGAWHPNPKSTRLI